MLVEKTMSGGRILGLPGQATGALAVDDNACTLDGPNTAQTGRQTDGVKIWPYKINSLAALTAKEMMVAGGHRLEPGLTFFSFKTLHHLALFKGGQGAVHRIQA